MINIDFTYATRQGKALSVPVQDKLDFEIVCAKSLERKYGHNLVAPRVHVVVSEHTGNVLTCVLLADSVMKFE